jgi:hypothetical protein
MRVGMSRGIALALVTLAACAAEDQDPVELLMRLRDQVMSHAGRIPNYTCIETIRRERFQPDGGFAKQSCDTLLARRQKPDFASTLRLMSIDRLRLDVAYTGEREIYSWAGANKFEDGEIDELIRDGAMGTGPFASMVVAIFTEGARFTFEGDRPEAGRNLMEYSFRVTEEQSRYRVRTHVAPNGWVTTAYTGTLLLDARTAELVRATTRTAELRPETSLCESGTTLEYGIVKLFGVGYLLPKAARQRFIGQNGFEGENTVSFSACREFQAQSTLTFGTAKNRAGGDPYVPAAIPLPAGLPVHVELTTPIDGTRAAAGDRIAGRLIDPIETAQKRTLVAAGAVVDGRLMRVENGRLPTDQLTIALRWEAVDVDGVKTPLTLTPDRRRSGLRITETGGLRRRGEEFELPATGEGRYGVFHFPGRDVRVPAGLKSEWLTAKE